MTDTLFKTEAEIAKLLGLPAPQWEATAALLERGGLPMKDPQFGDRRYWPAVRAYLDRRAGLMQPAVNTPDMEDFSHERKHRARA